MLVSKKQNWEIYQEPAAMPAKEAAPRYNITLNTKIKSECFILISVVAVMAMLVTLQSASIVKAGYELVQIKAQMAKLEKENDNLRIDIAKLKSPQRIQVIATKELGMIVPKIVYHASTAVNPDSKTAPESSKAAASHATGIFTVSKAEASGKR